MKSHRVDWLLVIASPDGFHTRRILELGRQANPDIDVVVRTHSQSELEYLERQGAGRVLMGERELALAMAQHALDSFGLREEQARARMQALRAPPVPARE